MKGNKSSFIGFLIHFITFVLVSYIIFVCGVYLIIYNSSNNCYGNNGQELLRIMIYGSSISDEGNTVSGTFSIIDSNGNEIAVIERSWSGAYLFVDFLQTKINNNYYTFPGTIYGKNRIFEINKNSFKGTDLSRYYNENGQCMLLGYGSSLRERKSLYRIANFTLKKYPFIDFLKKRNSITLDLSGCRTGFYYSISSTENGNLLVQEL